LPPSREVFPLDELRRHLLSLRRPIVVAHSRADPDAIASAYALSRVLKAPVGLPDEPSREGKAIIKFFGIPYELCPSVKNKDVVVVDTSEEGMLPCINLSQAASVTVIDHHASRPTIKGKIFTFSATSTAEIIYKLFRDHLDSRTRKILSLGVFYDTRGFRNAGGSVLRLVGEMLGETSIAELLALINLEEDVSERIARFKALRRSEVYRWKDYLVVVAEARSFEGSVASSILSLGADAALAWTQERDRGFFSFRLRERLLRKGVDVHFLHKILEEEGGWCGGHEAAGVCSAPRIDLVVKRVAHSILRFLGAGEIRVY